MVRLSFVTVAATQQHLAWRASPARKVQIDFSVAVDVRRRRYRRASWAAALGEYSRLSEKRPRSDCPRARSSLRANGLALRSHARVFEFHQRCQRVATLSLEFIHAHLGIAGAS